MDVAKTNIERSAAPSSVGPTSVAQGLLPPNGGLLMGGVKQRHEYQIINNYKTKISINGTDKLDIKYNLVYIYILYYMIN